MSSIRISNKHVQVDKARSLIVALIGVAAVITVISLVVTRTLLIQANYLRKVNGKKADALSQLKENEEAVASLVTSYKAFANQEVNLLSGTATGTGERDGDNARIILDALPSRYDFPALTASIEDLLNGTKIDHITGTDNASNNPSSAVQPKPQEIPVSFGVSSSYDTARDVVSRFDRSIRPFKVKRLELQGSEDDIRLTVDAITYYQPSKDMQIRVKDVK